MLVGKVCNIHPQLAGRRHNGGNCPGCVADRRAATDTPELRAARYAKNKEYRDKNKAKAKTRNAEWVAQNADKVRDTNLRRTGFTLSVFEAAKAMQGQCCAICRTPFTELVKKKIHADHCHTTGRPRGVLCQPCNYGLGAFRDDPERLRRAAQYLLDPPLYIL